MNNIIETILHHRSIRKFTDQPLSNEQIRTIVECAQAASTSSFLQAYSIIGVTDKNKKRRLAELAGNQAYVENNGHFFVFCADLHRHAFIGEIEKKELRTSLESTEKFMVALIDAALASQNAVIAAESLGLGACYIGGIRNNLAEIAELLKTPHKVLPLFGLAVGYPAQQVGKKPRLPFNHVYHENEYEQDEEKYLQQLKDYDEIISAYYTQRTNGKRQDSWTGQMAGMLVNPRRMYMKEYVKQIGFLLD